MTLKGTCPLKYMRAFITYITRNWKKEATLRQSSSSQDLENSISLAELVEELDMGTGNNSKVSICGNLNDFSEVAFFTHFNRT